MRLLHVIDSMDPARGGPVESIRQSAAAMKPGGHVSEVVSLDSAHAPWNATLPLRHYPRGRLTQRYGYSPGFTDWVGRHHADYDAIIIHGLWTYATLGTWKALRGNCKGARTPYVVFTHGMLDPWFGKAQPIKNVAKQLYWSMALGRVLADAQAVLFTTEEEQRLARTAFRGHDYKEQVVAYGTADVPANKHGQIAEFLAILPGIRNRQFLLFLGRIHPKKGCDLLLRAFAAYAQAYPQIDLVIAGPDQIGWCERLRKLAAELNIENRVHWPGMLSGDQKWGAFHAAEAFVLPSHQENFGIAVAEAMACAKPVLISNKVNIWPDVAETGAGLVAADDLKGTKDLLGRYLSQSPIENFAMGEAGRQCFLSRFQIRNAVQDLLAKLEKIVTAPHRAPIELHDNDAGTA